MFEVSKSFGTRFPLLRYLWNFRTILETQKTAAPTYRRKEQISILFSFLFLLPEIKTMLIPDHHTTKLGSKDYVFQVNKWPFSITCNPALPVITECFIDLALVKDMKITLKKLECRNISYAGYATKLVGSISQTVQVVRDGVANGTMHLKAKVVRNLTNLYGVDCIASKKLYTLLTDDNSAADLSLCSEASKHSSHVLTDESADDLIYDVDDTPRTTRRKRKNRFQVCNFSFTSSMRSSPDRNSIRKSSNPSQLSSAHANLIHPLLGQPTSEGGDFPAKPSPSYYTPAQALKTYQNPPEPKIKPIPPTKSKPQAPLQLQNLIFCGLKPPCPCVDQCRPPQLQLLPPYYPVYVPVHQVPCGPDCGCHHVHGDNQPPPNPRLCQCDPPRLDPEPITGTIQIPNDDPPLPPDFEPCGHYCLYQECGCLRRYEGRDWIS